MNRNLAVLLLPALLAQGLAERIADGELAPGEPLELSFPSPGRGTLHLTASSADADPRLYAVVVGASIREHSDDNGGGATTAYLALDVAPDEILELRVSLAEGSGSVALASSFAPETAASAELADRLSVAVGGLDVDDERIADKLADLVAALPATGLTPRLEAICRVLVGLPRRGRTRQVEAQLRRRLFGYAQAHLPPQHPGRLDAAVFHAVAQKEIGELDVALAVEQEILAARLELATAAHDRGVLTARLNLASTRYLAGELDAAAEGFASVLAASEELPTGDPLRLAALRNLASVELLRGYAGRAERRFAEAIDALVAGRAEPVTVADARANRARALLELGRPLEARGLLDQVLAVLAEELPPLDPMRVASELDRGLTFAQLGDLEGARFLYTELRDRLLAEPTTDRIDIVRVEQRLGAMLFEIGHHEEARRTFERVIAVRSKLDREFDLELGQARLYHAATLQRLGEREGARRELEALIEDLDVQLPADHPLRVDTRSQLAVLSLESGDLERARALQESVLGDLEKVLPSESSEVQVARTNLAWTLLGLERFDPLGELLDAFLDAFERGQARLGAARGPRELEALAQLSRVEIDGVLSIVGALPPGGDRRRLDGRLFGLIESLRGIRVRHRRQLAELARATPSARVERAFEEVERHQVELVRRSRGGEGSLFASVRARDAAESELLAALEAQGELTRRRPVVAEELRKGLAPEQAVVTFWRYGSRRFDPLTHRLAPWTSRYMAYVLRSTGLTRVELGPAEAIESAVATWRDAVVGSRAPTGTSGTGADDGEDRGVTLRVRRTGSAEARAGAALRSLVFDPLRTGLGSARTLVCAPDDALFQVPFDALPDRTDGAAGGGATAPVLGERFRMSYAVDLTPRAERPRAKPRLLAVGGIDYRSGRAGAEASVRTPAVAETLRRPVWSPKFEYLPASREEVDVIARRFEEAFDGSEVRLHTGTDASLGAFLSSASLATHLHLATHAYFAPESIPATTDRGRSGYSSVRAQARGFAPLLLCGLVFAGANSEAAAGLLTAEELATLDLARCRLAVLSACETNVGVRRAGQGVASLQSALHAAGVETSVASLWSVPDEATSRLMDGFYRALWEGKVEPAEALWRAKAELRSARDERGQLLFRLRDWGGWVVVGQP